MSGEPRSDLVDVTYQQLHSIISSRETSSESIDDLLKPRTQVLADLKAPFGKPNPSSKSKLQKGEVQLADGVKLKVDGVNRDVVLELADKFQIDEVQALVLLRSFFYNEGIPTTSQTKEDLVDELTILITPFYQAERLATLHVLLPLFRAMENSDEPSHKLAAKYIITLFPDRAKLADTLLTEYTRKRTEKVPKAIATNPREASRWVKHNVKEQFALLEVLFWAVWSYIPCDGPFVERLLTVAYESDLGEAQENSTFLLDSEGGQLMKDATTLWTLITIEVFSLERFSETPHIELSASPQNKSILTAYPDSLTRIHALISSSGHSKFASAYLAWAYIVSRLESVAKETKEIPGAYRAFFEALRPKDLRSREPISKLMAERCLGPNVDLLKSLHMMLTNSPLFVTALAWRSRSAITDPNAIAFRAVLKGLVMTMVELVPVDFIPDYDALIDVWISLFGRSEPDSVAPLCAQFWTADWHYGTGLRKEIIRVATARFPVQFRPLLRLLRAMTGVGFLDTDPLSVHDFHLVGADGDEEGRLGRERAMCDDHVFWYFDHLPTYAQVIPGNLRTGAHALYDKAQVRMGKGLSSIEYVNTRPVKVPGGSTVPVKSSGTLLSEDAGSEGNVVLFWDHQYSGWAVVLEFLVEYVSHRSSRSGGAATGAFNAGNLAFKNRRRAVASGADQQGHAPVVMRFADIGLEMGEEEEVDAVTDALDLIRSTVQDNRAKAQQVMEAMEAGSARIGDGETSSSPDLVQLTTFILEDALARSAHQKRGGASAGGAHSKLIASAISVLSALLALPQFSARVWLYLRSTGSLFGSDRAAGFASAVLAAERLTGQYTMTLALLHLMQELFKEASEFLLPVLMENKQLQAIKEEVLMRATRFVHGEIWVEHSGWKYAQLGDRFEIGRRITAYYVDVLVQSTPGSLPGPALDEPAPFAALRHAVLDAMLFAATTSSVTPLVSSITTARPAFGQLQASRRYGEARRLVFLIESALQLTRVLLACKQQSNTPGVSLLEHSILATVSNQRTDDDSRHPQTEAIDVLAGYITERGMGSIVPLEAMRVLYSLCSSLSANPSMPASILGRLSDPEAAVTALVRIVQHPYDELPLRIAAWNFMALAIGSEPALATLFVTGHLENLGAKKEKLVEAKGKEKEDTSLAPSALSAACTLLQNHGSLWDSNPPLLASVLKVLVVIWKHGLEHKVELENVRKDQKLWANIAAIIQKDIGPVPEPMESEAHSQHEASIGALVDFAHLIASKAFAVQLVAEDMRLHSSSKPTGKPPSYTAIEQIFKSKDELHEFIAEASANSYVPAFYDTLASDMRQHLPSLSIESLRVRELEDEREYGSSFAFSTTLLRTRLRPYESLGEEEWVGRVRDFQSRVVRLNLDLSISHAQSALIGSWKGLLEQARPSLRAEKTSRDHFLEIAATIAGDGASEKREGDLSSSIHGQRLNLVLALVEAAWFAEEGKSSESPHFVALVKNLQGILQSEAQPPIQCLLGQITQPFHRSLLQIVYFCARNARILARSPKALTAENRIDLTAMLDSAVAFAIDGLRVVFQNAREKLDLSLDQDMDLLVAVFDQCIDPSIRPTATFWLTRCQETDVIRSSLELFSHIDLVGLSDLATLRLRRQPLYSPHILRFHLILARTAPAAARLASEGILSTYSNNVIASAANSGRIEVMIPELPSERSPAHVALCSMLSVVAAMAIAIGPSNHFVDTEIGGFIQLYAGQITRTLDWSIDDPLTFGFLEEMERVLEMFYAVAAISQPSATGANGANGSGSGPTARVLKEFGWRTLPLLQQLNYALTHPNHLASSLEPINTEERAQLDLEANKAMQASSELVDPTKRPILASVVHRMFGLTTNILSSLIMLSSAEAVLLFQPPDWPFYDTLLEVNTKVILGQPASQGTMLDLANCVLDVLRFLVDQSNPPTSSTPLLSSSSISKLKPIPLRESVQAARQLLEAIVLYAVTQLAQARVRETNDAQQADISMDGEDLAAVEETYGNGNPSNALTASDRRTKRASVVRSDRVDRVNDAATDLAAFLRKLSPIIVKSDGKLGGPSSNIDISSVLLTFLQERVMLTKS